MAGTAGSPKWLDPEEQQTWRGLIELILELEAEQEEALVETHGLTAGEYGVLVRLSEAPDRQLRMCDLAQGLRLSPSGLTRRVDGLVKRGLVTRDASTCDRRVMLASLTAAGMAKLEAAAPTHVAAVRRSLFDHLAAEDVRVLNDVLRRARDARQDAGL